MNFLPLSLKKHIKANITKSLNINIYLDVQYAMKLTSLYSKAPNTNCVSTINNVIQNLDENIVPNEAQFYYESKIKDKKRNAKLIIPKFKKREIDGRKLVHFLIKYQHQKAVPLLYRVVPPILLQFQ